MKNTVTLHWYSESLNLLSVIMLIIIMLDLMYNMQKYHQFEYH